MGAGVVFEGFGESSLVFPTTWENSATDGPNRKMDFGFRVGVLRVQGAGCRVQVRGGGSSIEDTHRV